MTQVLATVPGYSPRTITLSVLGAGIAVYAIYSALAGAVDITLSRTLALAAAVCVLLLQHPLQQKGRGSKKLTNYIAQALDMGLISIFFYATHHLIGVLAALDESMYVFTIWDVSVATCGILIIMEATRRAFGWSIVCVTLLAISMMLLGPYLPGFLHHSGFSMDRASELIWFGFQGVFGTPLGIVIQVVMIFIVFGAVLEKSGASEALIRVALALTGGTQAGPAHAAVIGSAIFGSMSGSVTANVVGTGTFTIPMIKRKGFSAAVAGAIEAAASTGGQITPPVMGAAAFLMADLLSTSYANILLAALVPSIFYYMSLFFSISIEARRCNIKTTPQQERVRLNISDLLSSLGFLIPIIIIAVVMVVGYSAAMAGVLATISAAALGLFRGDVRKNWWRLYGKSLIQAGIAASSILVVVACIGVVIGIMNLTGLGISFASLVASYAASSLMLALVITALACLVLGMGMPTLPAYLIIVLVMGPALQKLGIEPIAAHMFVLYFGVLSAITPPVAIGAFAAAPIAESSPMLTAVHATRLAIGAFVIPFVFVYQPQLLLQGTFDFYTFTFTAFTFILGIWYLNSALASYSWQPLGLGQRVLHIACAAALLIQWPELQWAALCISLPKMWMDRSKRNIA